MFARLFVMMINFVNQKFKTMKRTFKKIVTKKILTVFGFAVCTLGFSSYVNAKPRVIEILTDTAQTASIKYIGSTDDNAMLLNLKIENPGNNKFILSVEDEDGYVLYSQKYSDKDFNKTFKVLNNPDTEQYNFVIASKDKSLEHTFVVTAKSRMVNDVIVTPL